MAAEYILAIDYGSKRVGVAIAHEIAKMPRPLTTLANTETLLDDICSLVEGESVQRVVVGLPRGMDGGHTAQTYAVEAFAAELAKALSVPVDLADETLTSVDAEQTLAGSGYTKGDVDALAATYILDRYFTEQQIQKGAEPHAD